MTRSGSETACDEAGNHGRVLELETVLPVGSLRGSPRYEVLGQAHIQPFLPRSVCVILSLYAGYR